MCVCYTQYGPETAVLIGHHMGKILALFRNNQKNSITEIVKKIVIYLVLPNYYKLEILTSQLNKYVYAYNYFRIT